AAVDTILSTTPAAGASVATGSAVNVTRSLGPANVTVPNIVGLLLGAAPAAGNGRQALQNAGLVVGTITSVNNAAAVDTILSTTPAAGASVATGSAVNVTRSLGPANVTVPNIVGLLLGAAPAAGNGRQALQNAGLVVGTITSVNNAAAVDTILSTTPAAGASVATGSAVNVTRSLGPAAAGGAPVVAQAVTVNKQNNGSATVATGAT